ncbi:MAG: hypothetical protein LUM44_11225 [Pyrinomonadaceae bacterium]|nr:hypothetical protein [Pyrinomonadaceae bacterium]
MEKDKDIKRQAFTFSGDWFMLPETEKKTKWRYAHEVASADLFTALYRFMEAWSFEPYLGNKRADRGMKFNGKTIYFEVDLCTESIRILEEKIDNYLQHQGKFNVIFSFLGESKEVTRRGNLLLPYLQKIRHGNQFVIANHTQLLTQPLGQILYSPKDELLSLKML